MPSTEAPPEDAPDSATGAPTGNEPVLRAEGLHYAYGGSPALLDVSLAIRRGEIVTVAGARGSGKSTLLRCLAGQLLPQRGEVWFDGVPVHGLGPAARDRLRRRRFGWIGSEPQLVPELTGWENAALPLLLNGSGHRAARRAAEEWLSHLDVAECALVRPAELLQAQRQRIALARALVHRPALLFADEPTAPLHRGDRAQVLRTLTAAARSHGITVLLATHDTAVTSADVRAGAAAADRTVVLDDGRCSGPGPALDPEDGVACSLSA